MRTARRTTAIAATISAATVLAACTPAQPDATETPAATSVPVRTAATTSTSSPPATSPAPSASALSAQAPPDGLTASLVQYRRDQPRRYVAVKFDNRSGRPLDVTLLTVTLPGFASSGDVRRTTDLEDGRRVDLPVPLGDVRCDREPEGTPVAQVRVGSNGTSPIRATVPIDDDGLLDRLRGSECAIAQADATVDLSLSSEWERHGSGADLTLGGQAAARLTDDRRSVDVSSIGGGVLYAVPAAQVTPALPVRLDASNPRVTIRFELVPARCAGHAIAEARRLSKLIFVTSVDGAEAVPLREAPDDAGLETLVSALRERCATG